MQVTVTHEEGTEQIEGETGRTLHDILQANGINVQNYIIRKENEIVSEKETLDTSYSQLELIKIVSGG